MGPLLRKEYESKLSDLSPKEYTSTLADVFEQKVKQMR
jgi:hypothetical protein